MVLMVGLVIVSFTGIFFASVWNFIKRRWLKGVVNLFFFLLIVFLCSPRYVHSKASTECIVPYPTSSSGVTFVQKHIHPFLAEYEYKIRFESGANLVERWLPRNIGGRTLMNVYWYPEEGHLGPYLRLEDYWGEYLSALSERKTYLIVRDEDRVYAGEITTKERSLSIESFPEVRVRIGPDRKIAEDITDSPIGRGSGEYLGRIDGRTQSLRFVPVFESPEEKIEKSYSSSDAIPSAQYSEMIRSVEGNKFF